MRGVPDLLRVDHGWADPVSKAYFHVTPRHEVQRLAGLGNSPKGDKSQIVRLLDVFFIGPVMAVGGAKLGGALGKTLVALGIATILYNAKNYKERARIDSGGE